MSSNRAAWEARWRPRWGAFQGCGEASGLLRTARLRVEVPNDTRVLTFGES